MAIKVHLGYGCGVEREGGTNESYIVILVYMSCFVANIVEVTETSCSVHLLRAQMILLWFGW